MVPLVQTNLTAPKGFSDWSHRVQRQGAREPPYLLEEGVVQEGAGIWPGEKGEETQMTHGLSLQTQSPTLSSETPS